jgi:putative restriction endonuclease
VARPGSEGVGYVAVTDEDWFRHLLHRPGLEEVNFWQPSGGRGFRLPEWSLFFFKLKAPVNAVCGAGLFTRHEVAPAWLAWESFGEANGAESFDEMRRRIERYRRGRDNAAGKYDIGCIIVAAPVLLPPDEWIPQPRDWSPNIVQGKTYDMASGEGLRLRDAFRERLDLGGATGAGAGDDVGFADGVRRNRLGQGVFRMGVVCAYGRACAVTGEHSLPVVDAAHIRPVEHGGSHGVPNGLALRTDIHRLFDRGYLTVDVRHRLRVSERLREEWANGRTYYALEGRELAVPRRRQDRPDPRALEWHNDVVFRA